MSSSWGLSWGASWGGAWGEIGPPPDLHPLPPIVRTAVFGARAEVAAMRILGAAGSAQRAALAINLAAVRD